MASLLLFKNPLRPYERLLVELEAGERPIDWLVKHYPDGFGAPIDKFLVNGAELPIDDLDYLPAPDDNIAIVVGPGAFGAMFLPMLMNILMSVVMSLISMLFAPKPEKEKKQEDAPKTYNVSSAQNEAKLGDPVPVLYGTFRWSPEYASQPYTWYQIDMSKGKAGKELSLGIHYLDVIMCLGSGVVDVQDIFVGETNASTLGLELVTWKVYHPKDHGGKMGVVGATFKPPLHENVFNSPEVSNQEFVDETDKAGFFILCKRGQRGRTIQNDVIFQQGLYRTTDDGVQGFDAEMDFLFQEYDDADKPIGAPITQRYKVSTRNKGSHAFISGDYPDDSPYQNAPTRITFTDTMPKSGRWGVKLVRISGENGVKKQNTFTWTGAKLFLDYTTADVYGDVTLLACRIKASRGLGNEASVRVVVQATRKLTNIESGLAEVYSSSAADAFYDAYTNSAYGAGRPPSEVDLVKLKQLRKLWSSYEFNHVFTRRTTVWNALSTIARPMVAEPIPLGAFISLAQDGVKPLRSMVFTDANIIKDSFKLNFNFNTVDAPDGVEIEYSDPIRYKPAFARYPAGSVRPERFKVEGITKDAHAAEYAIVLWQRRLQQRMTMELETELEGLIVSLGDRVGVSTHVPRWGESGLILGASANTLQVDKDLDWAGGPHFVILRRANGSCTDPIPVTEGARPNQLVLDTMSGVVPQINGLSEFTIYTFGELETMVKDFIVTQIRPSGTDNYKVRIEGMVYRPTIFNDGLSFLGGAIVGNRAELLGAMKSGELIDSHEYVPEVAG